ncbi:DUF6307 family protein [Actinocrispum sp. NPDC049592]|uniref:DUF6307 family protein n=1 Tax=Actinocrispum sp. NPDC049592 TaxID=3154835 RepID=UPI003423BDD7
MTAAIKYVSPYQHRVNLVADTLRNHSKLDEKAALDLAERVVDALNHIPEKVR